MSSKSRDNGDSNLGWTGTFLFTVGLLLLIIFLLLLPGGHISIILLCMGLGCFALGMIFLEIFNQRRVNEQIKKDQARRYSRPFDPINLREPVIEKSSYEIRSERIQAETAKQEKNDADRLVRNITFDTPSTSRDWDRLRHTPEYGRQQSNERFESYLQYREERYAENKAKKEANDKAWRERHGRR